MLNYLDYKIDIVEEISSTNTFLKQNYEKLSDNYLLVANKQTKGRGRFDHIWESNDNIDITMSLLKLKKMKYEIIIPLAIMKTLREYGINAFIKWPNDIYVLDMKISGILIEDVYLGNTYKAAIIGIGINMTDKLEYNACGINSYTNIDKLQVIYDVLRNIDKYLKLNEDILLKQYKNNNLVLNRIIIYNNQEYKVIDFTKEGYLVVIKDGIKKILKSNEISIKDKLI